MTEFKMGEKEKSFLKDFCKKEGIKYYDTTPNGDKITPAGFAYKDMSDMILGIDGLGDPNEILYRTIKREAKLGIFFQETFKNKLKDNINATYKDIRMSEFKDNFEIKDKLDGMLFDSSSLNFVWK